MNDEQYRLLVEKVAKKYGKTSEHVEKEIVKAIEEAWARGEQEKSVKEKQKVVPCEGEKPTPKELVEYVYYQCTGRKI